MAQMSDVRQRRLRRERQASLGLLAVPGLVFLAVAVVAASYIAYVLWPRWPGGPVAIDAPSMPITVAGQTFNIEPAAIRQAVQRKPGTQERVDIAYLWPSLTPPDPSQKPTVGAPIDPNERLFVTIANGDATLPPLQRLKTIYPRYLAGATAATSSGLTLQAFRDGTPYQGEDLIYDANAPEQFAARCTRKGVGNSGMCLYERRIGDANVTLRFPRDWLADWHGVAQGIARLLARLHPETN